MEKTAIVKEANYVIRTATVLLAYIKLKYPEILNEAIDNTKDERRVVDEHFKKPTT